MSEYNVFTATVSEWLINNPDHHDAINKLAHESKSHEQFAEKISNYVAFDNPLGHQADVYADLLSDALEAVDWLQLTFLFADSQYFNPPHETLFRGGPGEG